MKTSREGIDLITKWEGCKLKAYQDSGGVWTIGYGHTSAAGDPAVKRGLVITEQDAKDILARDLLKYEAAVGRALRRTPSQAQFDAMVSLCYNIGPGAFARSSVVRHFNDGAFNAAANAFLLWVKDNGKIIKGLQNRRADERALFLRASKPVSAAPVPQAPPAQETPPTAQIQPAKGFWAWLASFFTKTAA